MTRKFYQSEQGNITLLSLDNTLLIWTDTPGSFMVTNPTNPGNYTSGVGEIDVPEKATPEQILSLIREQTGKKGWEPNPKKVPVFLINEFTTESGPGESVTVKTIAFPSEADRQEYIIDWVNRYEEYGYERDGAEFKFYAPKDYIHWLEFPAIQYF